MDDKLNEDIILAKKIISNELIPVRYGFNKLSGIYRGTNEIVSAKEYVTVISNKKRILSVIGSGDQILNSILLGSKDIEGYDISIFPKYFLMLKIAAIKSLTKEEYLAFFYNNDVFNSDLYSKMYMNLDSVAQEFWDSLFEYFDHQKINRSMLFRSDEVMNIPIMNKNNLYLQDKYYDLLKSKLNNISLKYLTGNIFELVNDNMENFDLVNLSNIIQHIKYRDINFTMFKSFVESIPLNENGIVLSYLFSIKEYWEKSKKLDYFDDNYDSFSLTSNKSRKTRDGLLVYRKRKKSQDVLRGINR